MAEKRTLADLKRHESVELITAKRLMAVVERIETTPGRYNQRRFGHVRQAWRTGPEDFNFQRHEVRCNSACCVAGHAVAMFATSKQIRALRYRRLDVDGVGHEVLDPHMNHRSSLRRLFDPPAAWPARFRGENDQVGTEQLRRRVEHFIETGSMN